MDYWYILFVKTTSEEKVRRTLVRRLDAKLYLPFVPTKVVYFKRYGVVKREVELCFPSYVFIQSSLSSEEFINRIFSVVFLVKDVYAFLRNSEDRRNITMHESERLFLCRLFGENFVIEGSIGTIIGGKAKIMSGTLVGLEGIIKKIDRHRRKAVIEISVMRIVKCITLGLEITEKS